MIAVGAADRRITTYPGPSPTAANVKIPTLVPPPPLFLAVSFCFVFENLYSTSPHFSLQFIQASCIHIDLLPRVHDAHRPLRIARI